MATPTSALTRDIPSAGGVIERIVDQAAEVLRAGAALVVAGLAAQGITEIRDVHHIDRGYDDIVGRLAGLGASISRVRR